MIFLGDSLSNQQGDSLMGMLGWHPDWMTKGAPRNSKVEATQIYCSSEGGKGTFVRI